MALECVLHDTSTIGISTVVLGRVVNAAIDESVMRDGHPDVELLAPLARLGRDQWSELGPLLEISRIPYEDWPGHYSAPDAPGRPKQGTRGPASNIG